MKKTIALSLLALIGAMAFPMIVSAQGEDEQTVQISDVPSAVQTTIKEQAGTDEIVRIEKKTEDGQTVYEAIVDKDGKERRIKVDENGNVLNVSEPTDESEGQTEGS